MFLLFRPDRKSKICDQLLCRLELGYAKQSGSKIYDVSFCSAGKTIVVLVNLHTGMVIIMEGAACHLIPVDLDPVLFHRLQGCNIRFNFLK